MVYLIIILPLFTAVADSLPCVFFVLFFLSLFCAFLRVSSWKNCTHGWVLVNSSPLLACSSLSLDSPSEEKIIKLKYVLTLNINPVKTQLNLTLFLPTSPPHLRTLHAWLIHVKSLKVIILSPSHHLFLTSRLLLCLPFAGALNYSNNNIFLALPHIHTWAGKKMQSTLACYIC